MEVSTAWAVQPSLNRHLNVVEGFECLNDTRSYVVWGLNAPGRVSHGQQALGDGSDKDRFKIPSSGPKTLRHMMSPGTTEPGSHPGARPGLGTRRVPGGHIAPCGSQAQMRDTRTSPSGPTTCRRNHEGPVQRGSGSRQVRTA
ncbi:hypothetical protein AMECASPLE_038732 [Ameca splendens]|uniref:Uncharacterized protein n=1 Tax=Ameca splendens TaxID=208324 RepID=A0ABV0Y8V1_9TELE